jgi:diketogulonate reductase-like aldo/keto reductase
MTTLTSAPHLKLPSGAPHPYLLYGTAWKKDATSALVLSALQSGFRGIDTANQPKHYREDLVGAAIKASGIPRSELYIQTKFTPPSGQDHENCPYPLSAPLETQVEVSVGASLRNLGDPGWIDTVLLHTPLDSKKDTARAWKVLEGSVESGVIRQLGISNVTLPELEELYVLEKVKPQVVQNRFYPGNRWDHAVRHFCRDHGIVYQAFWVLTGNPELLRSRVVEKVAERIVGDKTRREEGLYLLVMALGRGWEKGGIAVLDGTTRVEAMKQDLELPGKVAEVSAEEMDEFRRLIHEPDD